MGLMWSLFLIGHLYFEWYMVRLTVLKGHHKGTCHDAIGLCAQHKDTTMGQHTFYFSGIRHDLVLRMDTGMTSVMSSKDLRYSLLYLLRLRSNGFET